jgi:hypothetical protein
VVTARNPSHGAGFVEAPPELRARVQRALRCHHVAAVERELGTSEAVLYRIADLGVARPEVIARLSARLGLAGP